ncbi:MAG: hypothetical protein EBY65_04840 [Acidimicrobiia bacterium]|nr:hypothetical protein [Acidimicrobiia bacterium]
MIVGHLLDETTDPDSWRRFREVVEGPEPDLTGGYDYYQKPGHLNYVNAHALDEYGVQLAGEFGFEPLAMPTDFEPPELLDVDAWLDDPGPVRHPPDGSLAPIPYDPEAIIHG